MNRIEMLLDRTPPRPVDKAFFLYPEEKWRKKSKVIAPLSGFAYGRQPESLVPFLQRMAYEMEIKDEAKAALRALPEDLRRQVGFRLEDLDDRRDLARVKKKNADKPGTDWKTVKKEFGFEF